MRVIGRHLWVFTLYCHGEMSGVVLKLHTLAGALNCRNSQGSENVCMCFSVCVWIRKFVGSHPCLSLIMHSVNSVKGIKMLKIPGPLRAFLLTEKSDQCWGRECILHVEFVADAQGNYEIIFIVFITVPSGTTRLGAGAFCGK